MSAANNDRSFFLSSLSLSPNCCALAAGILQEEKSFFLKKNTVKRTKEDDDGKERREREGKEQEQAEPGKVEENAEKISFKRRQCRGAAIRRNEEVFFLTSVLILLLCSGYFLFAAFACAFLASSSCNRPSAWLTPHSRTKRYTSTLSEALRSPPCVLVDSCDFFVLFPSQLLSR